MNKNIYLCNILGNIKKYENLKIKSRYIIRSSLYLIIVIQKLKIKIKNNFLFSSKVTCQITFETHRQKFLNSSCLFQFQDFMMIKRGMPR